MRRHAAGRLRRKVLRGLAQPAAAAAFGAGIIFWVYPNGWFAAFVTGPAIALTWMVGQWLLWEIRWFWTFRQMVRGRQVSFPPTTAPFSVRNLSSLTGLTGLAAWLAGPKRPALRDEWRAHLAGESGHDPVTWPKVRQALGFVVSGIRFRLADAADLAWRPVDAVLASRILSNLFVWGPVIVTLFAIVHHDGRFGLVADDQDPVALGAFLYGVIRTGRWWRRVKPPEPEAKRARE